MSDSFIQPRRRFNEHFKAQPELVRGIAADSFAAAEGRTRFPSTVVPATESPRLLVSGANQRKIGDRVVKGIWAGMPIYCVTLEERATCPRTCHHWLTCYGNNMHWSRRHRHGEEFEFLLGPELRAIEIRAWLEMANKGQSMPIADADLLATANAKRRMFGLPMFRIIAERPSEAREVILRRSAKIP